MTDLDTMRAERNRLMDRRRQRRLVLARLNGVPTSLVDAAPIRKRINELTKLGYSYEAIAATHGTGTAAGLRLIALGHHQRAERKFEGIADLPLTLHPHPRVDDNTWVPALGAQRRLRSLMRLGWRHEDVEQYVGRSTHVFVGNSAPHRIRAVDWRVIDAAWRTLCATPGPSVKSRTRAERLGYLAPLAWNDIDDPRERVSVKTIRDNSGPPRDTVDDEHVTRILAGHTPDRKSTPAERREIVRRWDHTGRSHAELARLTGWKPERYTDGTAA